MDELKGICKNVTGEEYHQPASDLPTRWSSTFTMIDIALKQKEAMCILMSESTVTYVKDALDDKEWKIIEDLFPILEVFAAATKVFSGQQYASLYCVDDVYKGLVRVLEMEDNPASRVMSEKILEYQNKLLDQHWIPRILHPSQKLDRSDDEYLLKRKILEDYAKDFNTSDLPTEETIAPIQKKSMTALQKFNEQVRKRTQQHAPTAEASAHHNAALAQDWMGEFEIFLDEHCAPDGTNELSWWAIEGKSFPILQAVARDWMAAPASSVPCEQLFSIAGNTVTKNRNRLAPKTTQSLMCLNSWWKFQGILDSSDQE